MGRVLITDTEDFSPELMFGCGQCFRFKPTGNGVYGGVAFGKSLTAVVTDNGVELNCPREDFDGIWADFFDLGQDYAEIRGKITVNGFMKSASEFGKGIRILRQDFWETVCSFVISQCNNIPRIQGIIERLCVNYGEKLPRGNHAFPSAEKIAGLSADSLRQLGAGYRAQYILNAAQAVVNEELSPEALKGLPIERAKKTLCSVRGIGGKVADCILLYGLHRLDAFPMDVWIKRAMSEFFPPGFEHTVFGDYAGVAQQYIFHYVRYLYGKTG